MEWVSIQPELETWLRSDTSSLLWISGSPGQGKSVLCKYLLGFLETTLNDRQWKTGNSMVIHFFCSGQLDPQFKNAATMLKTLIVQLLSSPHMFERLPEQYQKDTVEFQTAPLASLWMIFSEMICDGQSPYIYCLIDAVDEFGKLETQGLLERIQDLFASRKTSGKTSVIKFLLTSRPEAYISRCLNKAVIMSLQARRENIQRLVDAKVDALSSVFDGFKTKIKEQLGAQAGSTFLWVDITIKRINRLIHPNLRKIRKEIDDTPVELRELYKKLTHKICEDEDNARLLIWVLYARRPLKLRELEIALAVRPEEHYDCIEDLEEVKTVLTPKSLTDSAGLLLEIKYGAVFLIHQSVKDFLLSNFSNILMEHAASNQFLHNIDAETFLASSCVRYLSFRNFESRCLGHSPALPGDSAIDELNDQYPFLEYASKNWYRHIHSHEQTLSFSQNLNKVLCPTKTQSSVWLAFVRTKIIDTEDLISRAEIALELDIGWLAKMMLEDATTSPEEHFPIDWMPIAAATSFEVISVLVEFGRPYSSSITTDVLRAAAENWNSGRQVMELLLNQSDMDMSITADVVETAAKNSRNGLQIMELLLDRYGIDLPITPDVIKAVVGNSDIGFQVMELLLDRCGVDLPITPDIIKAVVGNSGIGLQITELLLDRTSVDIPVTADIAEAAGNWERGLQMIELLINRWAADTSIMTEIVEVAGEG